ATIQGARIAGARMIIAVDTMESKFAKAKELGATHIVNARADDPVKAIRTLTNGGVDYSFEAIGLKIAAEQCFDCLKPGGTATIIGMIPVGEKVELDGPMFLREKKIQGCSMGSNRFKVDMPRYIEFYRQGRLKLDEMVSRRGKLEDVNEAFREERRLADEQRRLADEQRRLADEAWREERRRADEGWQRERRQADEAWQQERRQMDERLRQDRAVADERLRGDRTAADERL